MVDKHKEHDLVGGHLVRDLESEGLHGRDKDKQLVTLSPDQRITALGIHLADSVSDLEDGLSSGGDLGRERVLRSAVEALTAIESLLGKAEIRLEDVVKEMESVHQSEGGYALGLFRLAKVEK